MVAPPGENTALVQEHHDDESVLHHQNSNIKSLGEDLPLYSPRKSFSLVVFRVQGTEMVPYPTNVFAYHTHTFLVAFAFTCTARQRQRWNDPQILPHVNWGDL